MPDSAQHKESNVVRFAANLSPETLSEERRSVEMNFYTGAKIERYDWTKGEMYYLRLSIEKGECLIGKLKGAPLLDSHMDFSCKTVHGIVTDPLLDERGCVATAVFSDDPESEIMFRKVTNGTLRNLSVGAVILHVKKESKDGEVASYVADKWYPREVSIVPLGADPDAHFLSDQLPIARLMDQAADQSRGTAQNEKENPMTETLTSAAVAQVPLPADLTATHAAELAALKARAELAESKLAATQGATTTLTAVEPAVDLATIAKDAADLAVKTERERFAGIGAAAKAAKLGQEFADGLINSGVSLADARSLIIEELAKASELTEISQHHAGSAGKQDPIASMEASAAALAASDPKFTKQQHFVRLLQANPKAYNDSVAA